MESELPGAQPLKNKVDSLAPSYPAPQYSDPHYSNPAVQPLSYPAVVLGQYPGVPLQPYPPAPPYPYPIPPQPTFSVQSPPILPSLADQPVIEYSNRRRIPANKQPVISFIGLTVITIVLSAVSLALHQWVDLCGVEVGLTDGTLGGQLVSLHTIKDVFCDSSAPDTLCVNMCSDLKDLIQVGKTTRGLGIAATTLTGLGLLHMVLLLVRPKRFWKGRVMRAVLLAGMLLWGIGAFMYVGYYVRITEKSLLYTSVGPGLGIAIAVTVLHLISCVLGNIAISKLV